MTKGFDWGYDIQVEEHVTYWKRKMFRYSIVSDYKGSEPVSEPDKIRTWD